MDLDDLLGGLAHAPADHGLQGLEAAVLGGVARERAAQRAARALIPAQAAAVVGAVAIGLVAGGAAGRLAVQPHEIALVATDLAPSTLLAASP